MMYTLPNLFGDREYLKEVSQQKIQACREECLQRGPYPCDNAVFYLLPCHECEHPPTARITINCNCSFPRVENVMDCEFHCKWLTDVLCLIIYVFPLSFRSSLLFIYHYGEIYISTTKLGRVLQVCMKCCISCYHGEKMQICKNAKKNANVV